MDIKIYSRGISQYTGIETCILGLALWTCDEELPDCLTWRIRDYAHAHQTGDQITDWVNAQKEIARHMPIAISVK